MSVLALLAHDSKRLQLVELAVRYRDLLSRCRLVSTPATGHFLLEMVGLDIRLIGDDSGGDDSVVVAALAEERLAAVVFLVDAIKPGPGGLDCRPILSMCNGRGVPVAVNTATAAAILDQMVARHQAATRR